MNAHPMMKCGHAANSRDQYGNPTCVICVGIVAGAVVVAEDQPNLEGRMMICHYKPSGHADCPSDTSGAFFEYRPNEATDTFYCGCKGWD